MSWLQCGFILLIIQIAQTTCQQLQNENPNEPMKLVEIKTTMKKNSNKTLNLLLTLPCENATYASEIIPSTEGLCELEEDEEHLICYKGNLTKVDKGHIGLITLTFPENCQTNCSYTGMIEGKEYTWVIEPVSLVKAKSICDQFKPKNNKNIAHVMVKLETKISTKSDVMRVPKDQKKKAIDEANNDAENEESEEETATQMEIVDNEKKISHSNANPFATVIRRTKKKKRPNRSKANRQGPKIAELAIFTDEPLYNLWEKREPLDPIKKMKDYILTLIHNTELLYQHKSLGYPISFKIVHFIQMKSQPKNLATYSGNAQKYLESFCAFAAQRNKKGKMWDHALLLTGLDLHSQNEKSVIGLDLLAFKGMAWADSMCLKPFSCSVSEAWDFTTSLIITHELGHSLGMEHDGVDFNKKCHLNKFIMSPTTGIGKITWSTCSQENLKNFINTGDPKAGKKDSLSVPKCLSRKTGRKFYPFRSKILPGKKYDKNKQCEFALGSLSYPVTTGMFKEICKMLYCKNPKRMTAVAVHPALEGTSCGSNKICRNGVCTKQ